MSEESIQELAARCEWLNATECEVEDEVLPAEVEAVVPEGTALIQVGELESITYVWTDGHRYRHRFELPAGVFVTQHGGNGIALLIGDFYMSERGFIDGPPPDDDADVG